MVTNEELNEEKYYRWLMREGKKLRIEEVPRYSYKWWDFLLYFNIRTPGFPCFICGALSVHSSKFFAWRKCFCCKEVFTNERIKTILTNPILAIVLAQNNVDWLKRVIDKEKT